MVSYLNEGVIEFGIDCKVLERCPCANAVFGVVAAPFLSFDFTKHDGSGVFSGIASGVAMCAFGLFLPAYGGSGVARATQDGAVGGKIVMVEMPVPPPLFDSCRSGSFAASGLVIGVSVARAACGKGVVSPIGVVCVGIGVFEDNVIWNSVGIAEKNLIFISISGGTGMS